MLNLPKEAIGGIIDSIDVERCAVLGGAFNFHLAPPLWFYFKYLLAARQLVVRFRVENRTLGKGECRNCTGNNDGEYIQSGMR